MKNRKIFICILTICLTIPILFAISSCDYISPESLSAIVRENPIDPEAENFTGTAIYDEDNDGIIDILDPDEIIYLEPKDNITTGDITPTLSIKSKDVSVCASYCFQVATDNAFSNIIFEVTNSSEPCITVGIDMLQNATSYYWRGGVKDIENHIYWGTAQSFTIDISIPTISSMIPIDNVILNSTAISFDWEDIEGSQYYWIQISNNSSFTDLFEENQTLTLSEYAPIDIFLNGEDYYWRIRVRQSDTWGDWSSVNCFTIYMELPKRLTVLGSTPTWNTTPTWKWHNVDGMVNVRVRVDDGEWVVIGDAITDKYTPATTLSIGEHTLEVQTTPDNVSWSGSGEFTIDVSAADNSTGWTYSFDDNLGIWAIDTDISGNIYLSGRDNSENPYISWSAKIDYSGNSVWLNNTFGGDFYSVVSDGFSGFINNWNNSLAVFNRTNTPFLLSTDACGYYSSVGSDYIVLTDNEGFKCVDPETLEVSWKYEPPFSISFDFIHVGNDGYIYYVYSPYVDSTVTIIEKINSATHIKEWDFQIQNDYQISYPKLVALSNGYGVFSYVCYYSGQDIYTYTFDDIGNFALSAKHVNNLVQDKDTIYGTEGTHLIKYDENLEIVDEYSSIDMSGYNSDPIKVSGNILYVGHNHQLKKIIIE